MKTEPLEIEIDNPRCGPVYFGPLGRRLRSRFEPSRLRLHGDDALKLQSAWPQGIPGQRLLVDQETGEAFVLEPLQHDEFSAIRERIKLGRDGVSFSPAREKIECSDLTTILYHVRALCQTGSARLIRGKLPEKIDGEPKHSFSPLGPEKLSPIEELAKLVAAQCAAMEKMAAAITKLTGK